MIADRDLLLLTGHRWLAPLMARFDAVGGARFAELLEGLGLSRSVLAASLQALIAAGWLARNPGHGHPLRPEYLLTPAGLAIAAFAGRVMAERAHLGLEPGQMPRWSLPVVARLADAETRFTALRASLSPVTPRALSLTLKQLRATRLIDRALEDAYPPSAIYGLTSRGARLAAAMG